MAHFNKYMLYLHYAISTQAKDSCERVCLSLRKQDIDYVEDR